MASHDTFNSAENILLKHCDASEVLKRETLCLADFCGLFFGGFFGFVLVCSFFVLVWFYYYAEHTQSVPRKKVLITQGYFLRAGIKHDTRSSIEEKCWDKHHERLSRDFKHLLEIHIYIHIYMEHTEEFLLWK